MLLIDDVQFLEGKPQHRRGVLPHLQRALRGRSQIVLSADRLPSRALDPRRAAARPLRVGADRRGRAAQPGHPADRPAPPGPRGRASPIADGDVLELAGRIDANMRQLHGALTRVIAHASLTARPLDSELIAELIPERGPAAPGHARSRRSSSSVADVLRHLPGRPGRLAAAPPPRARPAGGDLPHPRADRPLAAPDRPAVRRPRPLDRAQLAAPGRGRIAEDPGPADRVERAPRRDPHPAGESA